MSVLPLYIEIEGQRPVFEPCLNHRDMLSALVLPAILASQRRRMQEQNNRGEASQEKSKTHESQASPPKDASRLEPCLNLRDLLSGLVLPAILAAQRRKIQEQKNRDGASQEATKVDEGQASPQKDTSAEQKINGELKAEERSSLVGSDTDKFEVSLDVQHFSPEELSVKTVNGCIVVEGKHEEKQDEHGSVSRQFVRRYALPEGCHPDAVHSRLSSDGLLTVTAPRKPQPALEGERAVTITQERLACDTPSTSRQQENFQQ